MCLMKASMLLFIEVEEEGVRNQPRVGVGVPKMATYVHRLKKALVRDSRKGSKTRNFFPLQKGQTPPKSSSEFSEQEFPPPLTISA
ncbi:hypothetical protein KQX54_004967 [Cotesia glomerata]|uniref:Uncharacterized protein n=1 Tax=Cotesia glomerata TaxID=32391 RepID=A0AAV7HVC8_COTGL|nr:hypothetical protein KQX54_004967 [Cotesia glomerata]